MGRKFASGLPAPAIEQAVAPAVADASVPVIEPDLISAGSAAAMEALEQQAPAVNAPLPVIEEAVVSAGNTIDGLQSVADAIVVDPVAAQQAVQATADAVVAQPASPDGTPVLIFLVSALIVYQWSETIKAVPRVSGESPSSKLPSLC